MELFNSEYDKSENLDDLLRSKVRAEIEKEFGKSKDDLSSVINNLIHKYPSFVPTEKFQNLEDKSEKNIRMLYLEAILDQVIPDYVVDQAVLKVKHKLVDQLFPKVQLVNL